jgi:hypothetical protein
MSSPPETPRSKDPNIESMYRFDANGAPCEWGEPYHPGGYHPVHIQDVFNDRYRVIHKLGYVSFSTVWLTIDLRFVASLFLYYFCNLLIQFLISSPCCYVALKILTATATSDQKDAVSGNFIVHGRLVANNARSQHIIPLLDSFTHRGPNGIHRCLVYAALGPNVNSMLRLSPQCQIGTN